MLHFCIDLDTFFSDLNLELNQVTAMHELGHTLGFNIHSLAHFRARENGIPLTERNSVGDVPDKEIMCTGVKKDLGYATIPLPSEDILKFGTRRGVHVAQIVTKTVKQVTRNQFDCQDLEGAELESESFHPRANNELVKDSYEETMSKSSEKPLKVAALGDCISSHWERRLFKMDIMNPVMDKLPFKPFISPLTLAYFIDSGWYHVDINRMSAPDSWGRGAGCDFVTKSCVTSNQQVSLANSQFFCGGAETEGCTDDLTRKAACQRIDYDADLPTEYQYFGSPSLGGFDSFLDYCPTYEAKPGKLCTDDDKQNSRCMLGQKGGGKLPLCLPIACVINEGKLKVQVDGTWMTCESDGQHLAYEHEASYVICPYARRLCPTFHCPGNCLAQGGVGVCEANSGTCLCHGDDCEEEHNITSYTLSSDITMLEASVADYYFLSSDELIDDEKDIFEQTARMFNHMSPADVIGFVACSLVAVVLGVVVILFFIRMCRQGKNGNLRLRKLSDCFQRFWLRSEWTVSAMQSNAAGHSNNVINPNKPKMVATVLYDQRVHENNNSDAVQKKSATDIHAGDPKNGTPEMQQANIVASHISERTFVRSELPALPNHGRIVSIPGSSFIDDSPLSLEDPEYPLTVEGTVATTSVERTITIEPCSIANTSDSVIDSLHGVINIDFDDDHYTTKTDRPRRRRLADFLTKRSR